MARPSVSVPAAARAALVAAVAAALPVGCASSGGHAPPGAGGRWLDLTHVYDETTVVWPTSELFDHEMLSAGYNPKGYYYSSARFCTAEHGGTHIDAPVHFAEGHWSLDEIPLDRLIGPAAVVNVRAACAADPDYQVSVDDFTAWEAEHGRLPDGCLVLLDTGFAARWPDAASYLGTAERGAEAVAKLHFPGLHPDAAAWLVAERDIHAIGLDTASIDFGQSTHYESHVTLFMADIPAFENVGDMSELPPWGAFVAALPMKIGEGTGGPLRVAAWVPD